MKAVSIGSWVGLDVKLKLKKKIEKINKKKKIVYFC